MQNALRTFAGTTFAHVGFAFLAMGGWALYANAGHGLAAAALPAAAPKIRIRSEAGQRLPA